MRNMSKAGYWLLLVAMLTVAVIAVIWLTQDLPFGWGLLIAGAVGVTVRWAFEKMRKGSDNH